VVLSATYTHIIVGVMPIDPTGKNLL
jgi:hypothetical protein